MGDRFRRSPPNAADTVGLAGRATGREASSAVVDRSSGTVPRALVNELAAPGQPSAGHFPGACDDAFVRCNLFVMVTTVIAVLAGIALVVIASTPSRFQRLLGPVTRTQVDVEEHPRWKRPSEHGFMRACRLLTLVVGGVCILLGVLGIRSNF